MGDNDRISWSQVPGSPELWASDSGLIAILRNDGAGFSYLPLKMDTCGEVYVNHQAGGKGHHLKRLVASMVLTAFGHKRPGGHGVGYRDANSENCALSNLAWVLRGDGRVIDLKEKRCLGKNCNAMFMSEGAGHRLCPVCARRANDSTSNIFEDVASGELPDEPLLGGGHQ